MGKLINWHDRDKFRLAVAQYLNVTDVQILGESIVDDNGIVDLSMILLMQEQIQDLLAVVGLTYWADEQHDFFVDENGKRFIFE